jgi:hypothetical protein
MPLIRARRGASTRTPRARATTPARHSTATLGVTWNSADAAPFLAYGVQALGVTDPLVVLGAR